MIPRRYLAMLVLPAVLLPVVALVLIGLARLLAGLGDASGAVMVERLALAASTLWVLDLISLIIVLGVNSLGANSPGAIGDGLSERHAPRESDPMRETLAPGDDIE